MAYIAACILFFLAMLTFCDVIGRRFFDAPITGTIELVELGMAIAAFFSMPYAFLTNTHVAAEFLGRLAEGPFSVILALLRGTVLISMMGLMAYATTVKGIDLMENDRVTIELEMPLYPFKFIIGAAMWMSALMASVWLFRRLRPRPAN
ncbi:MAG: TRAP transporter small permease [Aestuariibacter sp.]|nr:TRAP transporter small permease [Aestuariibacter sp.]